MCSMRTDDELLNDYGKRGDTAAFDELYHRYRKPLFGFICQQLPETEANEVFQLCWEAVIQQASSYLPGGSFRSYLFTICRRRIADYWRQSGSHSPYAHNESEGEQHSEAFNPEQLQSQRQSDAIILRCVSRLPQKQREVFQLKQTGLAVDEISQLLQISFETIKSRIRACYKNLRVCWERHHD